MKAKLSNSPVVFPSDHLLQLLILLALSAFLFLGRVVPHLANFSPLGAIVIYLATFLPGGRKYWGIIALVLSMLASDLYLGFHSQMLAVYVSLVLAYGTQAMLSVRESSSKAVVRSGLGVITVSLVFFFVSNFFVWQEGLLYPKTFEGLVLCYQMALPFFRNFLIGTALYTFAILTVHLAISRLVLATRGGIA